MQANLDHIHDENSVVRTFFFKPEKPIHYTAGQFTELYLPHKNADDRGEKRWFTLSSSPSEDLFSITTKFAGDASSSFKHALWQLSPGAKLNFAEPMGDFVLPKDVSIPLLFIAGGIGVTPFHSIVKFLTKTHEQRSIKVILAANHTEDVLFKDLFKNYGAQTTVVISDPDPAWKGESGRLNAENILDIVPDAKQRRIYISGPEQMVETLNSELEKAGINKDQLIGDYFPGYANL